MNSSPQNLNSEEPLRIAREIVDFEFQDPRHLHMTGEMLVRKYAEQIESYALQSKIEGQIEALEAITKMTKDENYILVPTVLFMLQGARDRLAELAPKEDKK